MQSLKSPYILYNQQSVGSTLHNNLLFITNTALLIYYCKHFTHFLHSFSIIKTVPIQTIPLYSFLMTGRFKLSKFSVLHCYLQ